MLRVDEPLASAPKRVLIAGASGENREAPLHTFFTDREHIVRWAWSTRNKLKTLVPEAVTDFPGISVVRLRSQREVDSWVDRLDR